jgi:hypothetical protein
VLTETRPGGKIAGMQVTLTATITCPECAHRTTETMPEDACVHFWVCPNCGTQLKPQAGDCCVFCSYGTVPCPPVQRERAARAAGE